MKLLKFYSGLFFLVHVQISKCEFDDMGCTWNAVHEICRIDIMCKPLLLSVILLI